MYQALLIFITLCTCSLSTASNSYCQLCTGQELFLNRFLIPRETNSPININTKNVTCVNYSPLCIVANIDEKLTLKNNGKSVEAFKSDPKTKSYVTGGILRTSKYLFHKIEFLWTNNKNGACGTTIDGKGYPVEALVYFFNSKYKTFEQAVNHRDGIIELIVSVMIGCKPNKDFDDFDQKMKQIQKSEYSTSITLGNTFNWFISIATNGTYYAYAGEYFDDNINNHTYYCNTVIYFPNNSPRSISQKQFDTFRCLKNSFNKSYTNVQKLQPARQIVVEAEQFNLKIIEGFEE